MRYRSDLHCVVHPLSLCASIPIVAGRRLAAAEAQAESYRRDNEMLKQLAISKDNFVAALSHEMRTVCERAQPHEPRPRATRISDTLCSKIYTHTRAV